MKNSWKSLLNKMLDFFNLVDHKSLDFLDPQTPLHMHVKIGFFNHYPHMFYTHVIYTYFQIYYLKQ